jgi:anti-sigma factor RsiW
MPEEMKQASLKRYAPPDMHSESWWIRLLDDHLTGEERELWEAHLAHCRRCQEEWAALSQVDAFLRQAPAPPPLQPSFTQTTVARAAQQQRKQRWLSILGGVLIVGLVSALVFALVGSAYAALERGVSVVLSARQILFRSFVHTFVGLVVTWRTVLPFIIGIALVAYLLLMPNGLMVTFGILWLSRRNRQTVPARAAGVNSTPA